MKTTERIKYHKENKTLLRSGNMEFITTVNERTGEAKFRVKIDGTDLATDIRFTFDSNEQECPLSHEEYEELKKHTEHCTRGTTLRKAVLV